MIKARLYRGPGNGKVIWVRDNEYAIYFAEPPKMDSSFWLNSSPQALAPKTHVYNRTRHTHPDGSVFFEWSKPRKK
jgi:hypothetical protein